MEAVIKGISSLSDKDLLALRFCDLSVTLERTLVQQRARRVFTQLADRGIRVSPSTWLSEEWFNPEGVVGFAIPFYLAHPRLVRLERRLMLEAEGAGERECLRILRHETGHAVDEAFQLYRMPEYAAVFGSPRKRYPTSYAVAPRSREHVLHLNAWYAQSHPVEDFAETFATWLLPRHRWRRQYWDWPALRKLEAIDAWLLARRGEAPLNANRRAEGELTNNQRTLAEHYEEKREFYRVAASGEFDDELRRIFALPLGYERARLRSATSVLRSIRAPLRKELAKPFGMPAYAVDQVLRQLIQRARALNLRHGQPTPRTVSEVVNLVSRATADIVKKSPRLPL